MVCVWIGDLACFVAASFPKRIRKNQGTLEFLVLIFFFFVKSSNRLSMVNASNNKQRKLQGYGSFWEIFYAIWYWVVAYPYVNR